MKLNEYYNSIDLNEIERYILEKQEENLTLEFKTVNHPDYNDKNREYDKKNISEILSGFANSNGGIVIWGVKAQQNQFGQDVAKDKKPIKELTKFLNLLNRLEGQAVTPPILGVIHQKIEIAEELGYIKSYIPASEAAPHMANYCEKHYYKRSGDSFYQCEHYDIVDMFSRRKSPKLEVQWEFLNKRQFKEFVNYQILISLKNSGNIIAKYAYLALNPSDEVKAEYYSLDGNHKAGLHKIRNNKNYKHNYVGNTDIIIYPEAILPVDKFSIDVPNETPPPFVTIYYMITAEDMESITGIISIDLELLDIRLKNNLPLI